MIDKEVMVLALLVGGVLVMSMTSRQTLPPEPRRRSDVIATVDEDEMDLTDPTQMRIVDVRKDKIEAWKASSGWNQDAEMMAKYMLDECVRMIRMQNYFDEALGRPGVVGRYGVSNMAHDLPEEYKNWVAARTYCLNRANEFKKLWNEINRTGEHAWMAANIWMLSVPENVITRLESYNIGVSENTLNPDEHARNQQQASANVPANKL